jgi:hypothetical protein
MPVTGLKTLFAIMSQAARQAQTLRASSSATVQTKPFPDVSDKILTTSRE